MLLHVVDQADDRSDRSYPGVGIIPIFNDYNMNYPLSATANQQNNALRLREDTKLLLQAVQFAGRLRPVSQCEIVKINNNVLHHLVAARV